MTGQDQSEWAVNLVRNTQKGRRQMVSALIGTAFAQDSTEAAHAQWQLVTEQLAARLPKLRRLINEAEQDVLAYLDFPREHRAKRHDTNTPERLKGEVKRRSDVIGIFPNEAAIIRLVGALLLEHNDEWAIQRRYMLLETLATLGENGEVRLPAIAN